MVRDIRFAVRFQAKAACAVLAVAVLASPVLGAPGNPFTSLTGTWSGSGIAKFDGGKKESLRCKGYYTNTGGPHTLGLSIRCANASAKVELRANLVDANGAVSGNWEERTYNQSGTVTGRATASRMNLIISGGIDGSMTVLIGGSTHSVDVSTSGPTLKAINISMTR